MLPSAFVVAAALGACASVTPYDPPPVYPPAGPEAVREVHDLIQRIETLPRFSRETLEKTLAVKLQTTKPSPDPSYLVGSISRGTFSEVLYREIRPAKGLPRWHISVSIRRGVAIPFASVDRRYIGSRGTTGDGPYESISTWSMDRPGGLLHVSYGNVTRTLQSITVVREGSPELSAVGAAFASAKAGAAEIESLMDRFESISEFSRSRIESLMGLTLAPKSAPSNVQLWEAPASDSRVLSQVSYEESNYYGLMTSTVTLFVRHDVVLPSRYIDRRFLGPLIDKVEIGPLEPIRTRSVDRPGARLRLGIGESSDLIRKVVLVRERYLPQSKGTRGKR
jgi:hypothetical protein